MLAATTAPDATAMWSQAGQLDWWGRTGRNGGVGYAVPTAGNGGSEPLIFVLSNRRNRSVFTATERGGTNVGGRASAWAIPL
jgi:hypothetical protein